MSPEQPTTPLLEVRNLCVHYPATGGFLSRKSPAVRAVDGVSLEIPTGKTLGLVGESGSGKTTIGRAIIKLAPLTSGQIFFKGKEIGGLSLRAFFPMRKQIQMVFQDPFNSLNPRMSCFELISEPLDIHFSSMSRADKRKRVSVLLGQVGLPQESMERYPHEFSGGQRQRIGIARALAVEPELLLCDEPVSALDVSVQAQIVNLLQDLQAELGLTYLFIGHDLAVVEHISDNIAVMNAGELVEHAPAETLCQSPQHPYTKKLLSAVPAL